MKTMIAFALLALSLTATAQMYGDPSRYIARAPTTSASCAGLTGNVFQTAYSGMYAAPGGAELDLWIAGNSLVATVRLLDGRWFEGAATLGPADREVNVPLTSPTGGGGLLTICATHLTVNYCSRLGAAVIIGGALQSGPQIYTRNRTPANNPICVP